MLYVVGIINVIVYQIIALTNLKTTGWLVCSNSSTGMAGDILFILVENLIHHHMFIPIEMPYLLSACSNSMPRLLWLR